MSSEGMPTTRLSAPPTQRWEYHIMTLNVDGFFGPNVDVMQMSSYLNSVGMDGWELTSAVPVTRGEGRTSMIMAILKRPI